MNPRIQFIAVLGSLAITALVFRGLRLALHFSPALSRLADQNKRPSQERAILSVSVPERAAKRVHAE